MRHLPDDAVRHPDGRRVRRATPRRRWPPWPSRSSASACPRATASPTGCAGRSTPTSSRYAASDVAHLFAIQDHLIADLEEQRPARVGARRVRAARAPAAARCGLPRTRGCASRRPATCGARPPASPVRSRRGASGGPPRSTSRSASCSRTSASSASRSGPPKSRDQLRAIRGLDDRHVQGQLGDELLAAVAHGREHPAERPPVRRGRRARAPAAPGGHARVGLGQPAGPRPAHRHVAARHPGRHRGAARRHRGRPAQRRAGGPTWSASRSAAS